MNEIDEALREERTIEPSPFFTRRVMAVIRAEAQFAPLPFPWKRIVAAVVLLIVAIAAGLDAPQETMGAGESIAIVIAVLSIAIVAIVLPRNRSRTARV